MELILVVVNSAGMAENSQNGVSRSLSFFSNISWLIKSKAFAKSMKITLTYVPRALVVL